MGRHGLTELLRASPAEILEHLAPDDPRLAGTLYDTDRYCLISGGTLSSQAPTPFTLDGVEYPSVVRFYDALKIPDGELRARFVVGASRQALGTGRGRVDASFGYRGGPVAVGSRVHLQLIARAVSAKVAAHPDVRGELRGTGRLCLTMGASQPLGRVMPFALMVERAHL